MVYISTITLLLNLEKLLKPQNTQQPNECEKNGIYQLECLTHHKIYTGQTRHPFRIRFREHHNDFKYETNRSRFAQHIINKGHSFGPMNDINEHNSLCEKRKIFDTLEKFYIYRETKNRNQMNDTLTVQSNPIF